MTDAVRVAVVEDASLLRALMVETLHQTPGIQVVGSYATCQEARTGIPRKEVDALVLDLRLPDGDGLELGIELQGQFPHLRIVVVSDLAEADLLLAIPTELRPSWSYLLKGSLGSSAELGSAVRRAVREGRQHLDPALLASAGRPVARVATLTARQREILELLSAGLANGAIAEELGLAANTVEYHLTALYQTLGIPTSGGTNPRVVAARLWGQATGEIRGRAATPGPAA